MDRALKTIESYITSRDPETAKKKGVGAGASRSALLKLVMPHISGDHGDALARAAENGDEEAFVKLWTRTTENVLNAVKDTGSKDKKKTTASSHGGVMPDLQDDFSLLMALKVSDIDFPSRATKRAIRGLITTIRAKLGEMHIVCQHEITAMHPAEVTQLRKKLVLMKREQNKQPTKARQKQIDALRARIDAADAGNVAQHQHDEAAWRAEQKKLGREPQSW